MTVRAHKLQHVCSVQPILCSVLITKVVLYLGALHVVLLLAASHLPLLLPQQLLLHNLPKRHAGPDLQRVQPSSWPSSIQEVQQTQQAQLTVDDINGSNSQLQHCGLLCLLGRPFVAERHERLV